MYMENALIIFQSKKIRRTWFNNEWWFSVVDIIEALTESNRSRKYWSDLKIKLIEEGFEVSEKIGQLNTPNSMDTTQYKGQAINSNSGQQNASNSPAKEAKKEPCSMT